MPIRRELTQTELDEVDRIINETEIATDYSWNGEDSFEVDDAKETLRSAARRVRTYLSSLGESDADQT